MNTVDLLNQRLELLETHISPSNGSVTEQVAAVHKHLAQLYKQNEELATLNRIVKDLKLQQPAFDQLVAREEKMETILVKYPAIKQAYNNLAELANIDLRHIINYTDGTHMKHHDVVAGARELLGHEQEILELTEVFHQLVVKNMVVYEKYVDLMLRENQFWIDVDEKLRRLELARRHAQRETSMRNKY